MRAPPIRQPTAAPAMSRPVNIPDGLVVMVAVATATVVVVMEVKVVAAMAVADGLADEIILGFPDAKLKCTGNSTSVTIPAPIGIGVAFGEAIGVEFCVAGARMTVGAEMLLTFLSKRTWTVSLGEMGATTLSPLVS